MLTAGSSAFHNRWLSDGLLTFSSIYLAAATYQINKDVGSLSARDHHAFFLQRSCQAGMALAEKRIICDSNHNDRTPGKRKRMRTKNQWVVSLYEGICVKAPRRTTAMTDERADPEDCNAFSHHTFSKIVTFCNGMPV